MGDYRRVLILVLIMTVVATVIGGVAIGVLYDTTFEQQSARLTETAESQARLIEAVARYNLLLHPDNPERAVAATIAKLRDAHAHYEGFGETGEFTLAKRRDGLIVFLLSHRHYDLDKPEPVSFDSDIAEPMRRALSGKSGTVIGLDYRGATVLAAHEPVAVHGLGIVAKIDLAEIRAPFVFATGIVVAISLAVIAAGTFLFYRVTNPMVGRIQASETQFRSLVETAGDVILVISEDFRILEFNREAERIYGVSRADVLGKNYLTRFLPEEVRTGVAVDIGKVLAGTPTRGFENQVQATQDQVRDLVWNVDRLHDQAGRPYAVIAVGHDITERKKVEMELAVARSDLERQVEERTRELVREIEEHRQTERTLRQLSRAVEQSPIMVVITDLDGVIEYVNPRFTEMSGYAAEEAIGQNPRLLKSGDTPDEVYDALWSAITAGKEWRGELKDQRKDGRMFWASASISPVKDEDGTITHFVAMHEDITERKLAEIRMREATELAEIANRAKSELLANMSHELRTPLNAILGFSGAMKSGVFGPLGNPRYEDYVEDILESSRHLLELINDVLDVSAIEAGKMTLHEQDLLPSKVSEAAIRLIRGRAEEGRVSLTNEVGADLPSLHADERRVKQILLNLLSNAVKFTPENGRVVLDATLDDGGSFVFTVSDTGIGMDGTGIAKAMSQFGQVDSALARKFEGTGLGLPLTRGLAEAHGGVIDIESEPGAGTTVTVRFPSDRVRHDVSATG